MTAWTSPRIRSVADALADFLEPGVSSYPTPLFWWSGADLSRARLEWQLDQLKGMGVGGTIVGYSHLPDGNLDHGTPAPFTAEWWELFRWFTAASAERGMSTGIQDYGIIGSVLKSVAHETSGLRAGTLTNIVEDVPPGVLAKVDAGGGEIVSAIAWPVHGGAREAIVLDTETLESSDPVWSRREHTWRVSAVVRTRGKIGLDETDFDPLHPRAGSAVIETFYSRFEAELGELFGTSFRIFFQDELDLGILMPMWNDDVAAALSGDYPDPQMVHALWHDLGDRTTSFRSHYRDIVVNLLVANYFRPIYEWLDDRGVLLVMDQLSRGDLRLGHAHYADFMETMQWYHGPGNDDPDLRGPRGTAAFAISASIARAADRPLVINEAFHSSGWAVTPAAIVSGADIGFVSGANHVIMHGLNYTTEAGWWEWASPDFHFRQPWWPHSAPLWAYLARVSSILRCGHDAQDVAVLDPSGDLDLVPETTSPEVARDLLTSLREAGLPAVVVSPSTLITGAPDEHPFLLGGMPVRAIVLPGMQALRDSTVQALAAFVAGGGTVISVAGMPRLTETRSLSRDDTGAWTSVDSSEDAITALRHIVGAPSTPPGLMVARRRLEDADIFFLVNATTNVIEAPFAVPGARRAVEKWDAWTGTAMSVPVSGGELSLRIEGGQSEILVVLDELAEDREMPPAPRVRTRELSGPWTVEFVAGLPNDYRDFALDDRRDLGMESVHVRVGSAGRAARVDVGTRFFVLGPVPREQSSAVRHLLLTGDLDFEAPIAGLSWRPYDFSPTSGLEHDPLQRDLMTGPHGLKGVREDFLDPAVLDPFPPPGSLYFFCSRVPTPDQTELVHAGSRAAFRVWIDGRLAVKSEAEEPAAWYPPWSLRDLRIDPRTALVDTVNERATVVMELSVATDQPTRGYVALGGDATSANPAALRWWAGRQPARPFQPFAGRSREVRASIVMPPGSRTAIVSAIGPVVSASADGVPVPIVSRELQSARGESLVESTVDIASGLAGMLDLSVQAPVDLGVGGGVFTSPIRWISEAQRTDLAPWTVWGLGGFSGRLRYTSEFSARLVDSPQRLRLAGLVGSAQVTVNGHPVGVIFDDMRTLDLTGAVVEGANTIEIECANTLGNYYSRWPTPFASVSDAGGGFLTALLLTDQAG